jgi:hypothetical protein
MSGRVGYRGLRRSRALGALIEVWRRDRDTRLQARTLRAIGVAALPQALTLKALVSTAGVNAALPSPTAAKRYSAAE